MRQALFVVAVMVGCAPASQTPAAVAPAPAPQAVDVPQRVATSSFEVKDNALVLPGPVVFETGSDRLKPESDAVLGVIMDYLNAKEYVTLLRIEGHAEEQTLSERRAMAVARWLVSSGVGCERLVPVGFGANKPAYGDARDTRIEAVNAALRGHAIGGMPVDGGGQVAGDPCN